MWNKVSFWLATTVVWSLISSLPAQDQDKPNIIFILADDLGYGDLGGYGQPAIQTPRLDRMADEGLRFTQFYAGSTVCAPARCVLMTGRHTGHCTVRGNRSNNRLRPQDTSVAEVLHEAGYATALVGKWGLGEAGSTGIPNRKGFDEFYGYLNQTKAHNYYPEQLWRNEQQETLPGNQGGNRGEYSHDLFTEESLQFIQRNRDDPFFLYLSYTIPHANNELGNQGMQVPADEPSLAYYSTQGWPTPERNKAAMITRMDRDVGRILDALQAHGIDERTIVMFSSDNGPHSEGGVSAAFHDSNGPLRGLKRDLYEGGVRVPLIARWPGQVAPGQVSNVIGGFEDFLPTAAGLAGAEAKVPGGLDGLSLAPTLLGRPQTERHGHLYWEFYERTHRQAVRQGDWKAVRKSDGTVELYNLADDLGETNNLAAARPDVVAQMTALMDESHAPSLVDPPGMIGHWAFDEGQGTTAADTTGTSPALLKNMNPASDWVADTPGPADGAHFENAFALAFDGQNDFVDTNHPGIGGSDPRTVAFWVKTTDTSTHDILAWGNTGSNGAKWHLRLNSGSGQGVVGALRTEVQGGYIIGSTDISDGEWHHLASVFDGENVNDVLLYVDGVPENISGRQSMAVDTDIFTGGAGYLTIGGRSASRPFEGLVDDVAVFNRALSFEEVNYVMHNGAAALAVPEPGTIVMLLVGGLGLLGHGWLRRGRNAMGTAQEKSQ